MSVTASRFVGESSAVANMGEPVFSNVSTGVERSRIMFSHIQIGARDLPKMVAFYDAVLGCLGLERIEGENDSGPPGEGWRQPGKYWPQVFVQLPFNGLPATWGNGMQVSFAADSPQTVRAAWEQAMAMGGTDEGPPGPRPQYCEGYFGAYCRDPEGNKLCFVYAPDMHE
jgi:catechol 2,3-dioxygenase-like lactoylglutathione lyase family enzyme